MTAGETRRGAAFFDLDKTIVATSSMLAFGRPLYRAGLIGRRDVLRSAYIQFVFTVGRADTRQVDRMRDHLAELCAGWDVATLAGLVDSALHEVVEPIVYAEAVDLFAEHHAAGRDVVIVSASSTEIVGPIGTMLGADHVVATELVVADGVYTGEIRRYVYGSEKAVAIGEFAVRGGYDLATSHAYSDSVSDLPMLESVGHPHTVNADRDLRAVASDRQWDTLRFVRRGTRRPTSSAKGALQQ